MEEGDIPIPTYISPLLDESLEKKALNILQEYKYFFAWDYKRSLCWYQSVATDIMIFQ